MVAAFFYLRVVVISFLQDPTTPDTELQASPVLGLALGLAGVLTIAIGLAPQVLVTAAQAAGRILG